MTRYGRSPWIDGFPKSRLPDHERQRGPLLTDVVIIGGGLTGCATAYAFATAGVKVVLVEADRIGRGSSGASFGWIGDAPGPSFHRVEQAVGLRAARRAWQTWRRGALDFATLLRRLRVKCDLETKSTLRVARTTEEAQQLQREIKTRREAGVDVALITAGQARRESGTDAVAAIRTRDGATINPYRAALGLAAAAAARGALLFERSPAKKV